MSENNSSSDRPPKGFNQYHYPPKGPGENEEWDDCNVDEPFEILDSPRVSDEDDGDQRNWKSSPPSIKEKSAELLCQARDAITLRWKSTFQSSHDVNIKGLDKHVAQMENGQSSIRPRELSPISTFTGSPRHKGNKPTKCEEEDTLIANQKPGLYFRDENRKLDSSLLVSDIWQRRKGQEEIAQKRILMDAWKARRSRSSRRQSDQDMKNISDK